MSPVISEISWPCIAGIAIILAPALLILYASVSGLLFRVPRFLRELESWEARLRSIPSAELQQFLVHAISSGQIDQVAARGALPEGAHPTLLLFRREFGSLSICENLIGAGLDPADYPVPEGSSWKVIAVTLPRHGLLLAGFPRNPDACAWELFEGVDVASGIVYHRLPIEIQTIDELIQFIRNEGASRNLPSIFHLAASILGEQAFEQWKREQSRKVAASD